MYFKICNRVILCAALYSFVLVARGQQINTTHTMPFVTLPADAHTAGMGGIVSMPNKGAYAIFGNPASAAFSEHRMEAAYTFSSSRNTIIDTQYMHAVSGYFQHDKDVFLIGARYFIKPEIVTVFDNNIKSKPYDLSLDLGYSRKWGNRYSTALSVSYLHSHFTPGILQDALFFSLSGMLYQDLALKNIPTVWHLTANFSNFGILFNHKEEHQPTLLRLGTGLSITPIPHHTLHASIEGACFLEPISPIDAEGAIGMEYIGFDLFSLKGGYHLANAKNGKYSYFSAGCGITYRPIGIDFAYLFAAPNTPIKNSWWLSAKIFL